MIAGLLAACFALAALLAPVAVRSMLRERPQT
jgi:hypothetical protein